MKLKFIVNFAFIYTYFDKNLYGNINEYNSLTLVDNKYFHMYSQ